MYHIRPLARLRPAFDRAAEPLVHCVDNGAVPAALAKRLIRNLAMKPHYWDEAIRALAARDRVMARLIAEYPDIHLTRRGDPFTTLARAIVGQQISVKAAQTIWDRLVEARGAGEPVPLDPRPRQPHAASRRCARVGLSRAQGRVHPRPRAPLRLRPARPRARGRRSTTRR